MFPDLPDWPESPRTAMLAFLSAQTFRIEELVRDDHYVIRAELPGLDPAKDIKVTVDGRILTIHAERWRQDEEPHRTEFRYGSVTRSVRLPARLDAQDITARYRIPIENADMPSSNRATEPAAGSATTSPEPGTPITSAPPPDSEPAQQ